MFRWMPALFAALALISTTTATADSKGLITLQSAHSVDETLDRLEQALNKKGLTVFTRISHTEGAEKVGLEMQPTQVLVFGSPKIGTPIMRCAPAAAVDFPQKALVWEDTDGEVWLAYNDPQYLVERHNIVGCEQEVQQMTKALQNFSRIATGKDDG